MTATGETSTDLRDVSRQIVGLYKEQFGRGPTRCSSHWATPDRLLCILEDTLAPAERKLADLGQHQAVRDNRGALDHATLPELCLLVQTITGRKVRSFGSCVDTVANGEAHLMWSLYPVGYEGLDRVEQGVAAGEFGRRGEQPAERP